MKHILEAMVTYQILKEGITSYMKRNYYCNITIHFYPRFLAKSGTFTFATFFPFGWLHKQSFSTLRWLFLAIMLIVDFITSNDDYRICPITNTSHIREANRNESIIINRQTELRQSQTSWQDIWIIRWIAVGD